MEFISSYKQANVLINLQDFLTALSKEEDSHGRSRHSAKRIYYYKSIKYAVSGLFSALILLEKMLNLPKQDVSPDPSREKCNKLSRQSQIRLKANKLLCSSIDRALFGSEAVCPENQAFLEHQKKVGRYLITDHEHTWIVNKKKELRKRVTRCKICERNTIPMAHLMDHSRICVQLSKLNKDLMDLTNCIISECENAKHYKVSFDSLYKRKHQKINLVAAQVKSGKSLQKRNNRQVVVQGSMRVGNYPNATPTENSKKMSNFYSSHLDAKVPMNEKRPVINQLNTIRSMENDASFSPHHTKISISQEDPFLKGATNEPLSIVKLRPHLRFRDDNLGESGSEGSRDKIVPPLPEHVSPDASPSRARETALDQILEESGDAGISPIRPNSSPDILSRGSFEELEVHAHPPRSQYTFTKKWFEMPTSSEPLPRFSTGSDYQNSMQVLGEPSSLIKPQLLQPEDPEVPETRQPHSIIFSEKSDDSEESNKQEVHRHDYSGSDLALDDEPEPVLTKVKTLDEEINRIEILPEIHPEVFAEGQLHQHVSNEAVMNDSHLRPRSPRVFQDQHTEGEGVSVMSNYQPSDEGSHRAVKQADSGNRDNQQPPKASRFLQEAIKATTKKKTVKDETKLAFTPDNRQAEGTLVKGIQLDGLSSESSFEEYEASNSKTKPNLHNDLERIKKCREFFRQIAM